jgi:hypothetical protein
MAETLQILRRCQHCGSDMTDTASSLGYAQNPFCSDCHHERAQEAALAAPKVVDIRLEGRYFRFIRENRKAG